MSMLFGPLSETISSVSWRDCALAGDQIAGIGNMLPAATAVTDRRNSRRFIENLPDAEMTAIRGPTRQGSCHGAHPARSRGRRCFLEPLRRSLAGAAGVGASDCI